MARGKSTATDRATRDAAIVALYRSGMTDYAIAPLFGPSRPRCTQIRHEQGVESRPWRNREVQGGRVWTTDRRDAAQHGEAL